MAVESIKRRCRGKREKSREQAPSSALLRRMSRLTRDGTAEPVTRDQIIRHERGQTKKKTVQLTSSRIGNHTRLNYTLLKAMTVHTLIS